MLPLLPLQALTTYINSTGKTVTQFLADRGSVATLMAYHVTSTMYGTMSAVASSSQITTAVRKVITVAQRWGTADCV